MTKLVTVGLPVYRRLDYLPQALQSLDAQDYPSIELIVSDNGMNGPRIPEIVARYYSRPYRFRQNPSTVPIAVHFNQLVDEASGEYFILLSDDDEVSPNYVSEMVSSLERHPHASVALSRLDVMDEAGRVVRSSDERGFPLDVLSAEQFIRAWCLGEYDFVGFVTNLARTYDIREVGGYPDFPNGNGIDNALLIKLCLNSDIAFTRRCTFRYRVYGASEGLSASYRGLAQASRRFLEFLETDPRILEFADAQPDQWAQMRSHLVKMTWGTYYRRWVYMYRERLTRVQWVRAAFSMPFLPAYYRRVAPTLMRAAIPERLKGLARRFR